MIKVIYMNHGLNQTLTKWVRLEMGIEFFMGTVIFKNEEWVNLMPFLNLITSLEFQFEEKITPLNP